MTTATNSFKDTIKAFLDNKAATDELFAPKYAAGGKNIDDCVTYILNTVQKSGCSGFTDAEVYGMALHYYDETTIDVGKSISLDRVVLNHVVEITAEEKEVAKKEAVTKYQDGLIAEMRKKQQPKKKAPSPAQPETKQTKAQAKGQPAIKPQPQITQAALF